MCHLSRPGNITMKKKYQRTLCVCFVLCMSPPWYSARTGLACWRNFRCQQCGAECENMKILTHFATKICSLAIRPQRWSIFQGDGMVNVFFRPPLPSMVFQWFWQSWTITIECFLGVQPLEPMVFRWFSKFWGQWSTMVLRLTMESLVKIISPNDDNIISRYFKELWKIR